MHMLLKHISPLVQLAGVQVVPHLVSVPPHCFPQSGTQHAPVLKQWPFLQSASPAHSTQFLFAHFKPPWQALLSVVPSQLLSRPSQISVWGRTAPLQSLPQVPSAEQVCIPCLQVPPVIPHGCVLPGVHTHPSLRMPLQFSSSPFGSQTSLLGSTAPTHSPQ
jgi:hypothetical protein